MKPESGLLWSPWFRIIAERFLPAWWEDLDKTLNTDEMCDLQTIHRFDCGAEHRGGHGWTNGPKGPWLSPSVRAGDGWRDPWLQSVSTYTSPPTTVPKKPLLAEVEGRPNMFVTSFVVFRLFAFFSRSRPFVFPSLLSSLPVLCPSCLDTKKRRCSIFLIVPV